MHFVAEKKGILHRNGHFQNKKAYFSPTEQKRGISKTEEGHFLYNKKGTL